MHSCTVALTRLQYRFGQCRCQELRTLNGLIISYERVFLMVTTLPYASTDVCPSCGAETRKNRYRFSLVESPARTTIHTGNLCQGCYEEVVDFVRDGSHGSLE